MIQKLGLIAIIALLAKTNLEAQNKRLEYFLMPDTTVVTRIFPTVGLDNRLSIIGDRTVAFKGVRAGIRFGKKRNRLTVAYRWFSFDENVGLVNYNNLLKPINWRFFTSLAGYYYTISYQHILHDSYRFAFGTTADIGLGSAYDETSSFIQNINIINKKNRFVPIQFGVYSEFKATRFAGITAQAGYRWVKNYKMQPSINKLYLGIGVRLYFGSIYRHFKK